MRLLYLHQNHDVMKLRGATVISQPVMLAFFLTRVLCQPETSNAEHEIQCQVPHNISAQLFHTGWVADMIFSSSSLSNLPSSPPFGRRLWMAPGLPSPLTFACASMNL